jgi:isochorismate pyruvate lyase
MTELTTAEDCQDLAQIRASIDVIDEQIVQLIAQRGAYVRCAARFKKDADAVRAPQRYAQLMERIRLLAVSHGADADIVVNTYKTLVDGFIGAELREHAALADAKVLS